MATAMMYANLLRWEWFRLSRRVGFWVILGILGLAVAATLAITAATRFVPFFGDALSPDRFPDAVSGTMSSLAPFLGVVLAAFIFGGEFGWGTWRPALARGMAASRLILSKVAMGGIVVLAAWLVAWILSSVVGFAFGQDAAGSGPGFLPDSSGGWGRAAASFAGSWLVAVAYLALGSLLCVVGRSTAFGVGVGVGIVMAEIVGFPIASTVADLLWDVSLDEYIRWTLRGVSAGLTGGDDLRAIFFLPAMMAYIGGFCWLTLAVFCKRDLDSGNG